MNGLGIYPVLFILHRLYHSVLPLVFMENKDPLIPPPFDPVPPTPPDLIQPPPFDSPPPFEPVGEVERPPERGGCLTAFLILMIIANAGTILMYLAMGEKMMRSAHLPYYTPYIMSFFGVMNLIFTGLTYNWKKAGVIGIVVMAVITLLVNLYLGVGPTSFLGLIGVIILIALIQPKWNEFK